MTKVYKTFEGWRCKREVSNHRRAHWLDYQDPTILLLTLVTINRLPLFGYLQGEKIVRSALGQQVAEEIERIPTYKGAEYIEIYSYIVMPDHVHILLHIHERLPKHIGRFIYWFKLKCSDAYQALSNGLEIRRTPCAHTTDNGSVLGGGSPSNARVMGCTCGGSPSNRVTTCAHTTDNGLVLGGGSPSDRVTTCEHTTVNGLVLSGVPDNARVLGCTCGGSPSDKVYPFAPEYHDRILTNRGQLAAMKRYIHDNPRRLALKRANKDLFCIHQNIRINNILCTTMGNMFLADYPLKQVIQCSRRLTQEQIDEQKAQCLVDAEQGYIFITAAISEGEKQIARALREVGFPLIILLHEGFPTPDSPHYRYFKPQGVYFEACAAGKLLLIEPKAEMLERADIVKRVETKVGNIPHTSQRYRFVAMNTIAEEMVNDPA